MVLNFKFFFYGWVCLVKVFCRYGKCVEEPEGAGENSFAIIRRMRYNRDKIYEQPEEFYNGILPVFCLVRNRRRRRLYEVC